MNTFAQAGETLAFKGRDSSDFWFSCVDFKVVWDRRLSMCEKMVFTVICTHVNVRTRECPLRVKTIAEEAGCSVRSVQEALKVLVEHGIIERTECFQNGKQKASIYKIVGHRAPCYRGAHPAPAVEPDNFRGAADAPAAEHIDFRGAGDAGGAKNDASRGAPPAPTVAPFTPRGAADDVLSLRESNIYENKDTSPSERGAGSPREANFPVEEAHGNVEGDDLIAPDEAPPAMREAVDYFLLKTGRSGIQPEELSAIRALEEIHTPGRVNREIAQAVERFGRNGRPLSSLTLVYIYKSLQYQNSLKYVQGKSHPKREPREEEMPDPYEGAYL
jgi:DNA-binding Lrp family transcriptional regulator